MNPEWRKTTQYLIPALKPINAGNSYDIYPAHKITDGQISEGLSSLSGILKDKRIVAIDGYEGVYFDSFSENLNKIIVSQGLKASWIFTTDLLKSSDLICEMISPFTGGEDPLFGTRTDLELINFFNLQKLKSVTFDANPDIFFIIGPGASLVSKYDLLIYIDLPKNELQFRARAGTVTNLGIANPTDPKVMYKQFYFVDWVVLNKHKESIICDIDIFIDGQRPDQLLWIKGDTLRKTLYEISHSVFRVRPWFEPGAWGGTWIKNRIRGLSTEVPNYAWSFEMIVPENGLLIESSSLLFEISFDTLMFLEAKSVLGDCFERFGTEFPIRFDFLDTFDGGNLSLQCHPRPDYVNKHFGESYTQEETYYILDCKDNAEVYLGFKEGIDPVKFENALQKSFLTHSTFDVDNFIMKHQSSKHELFLIPYGTIHSSGKNNLVLEISSTPYIFTFKMYDWLRMDLDGKPRTLNIERGMDNLCFERKGENVREKLISKPKLINSGEDWKLWHLPTHDSHLYDVHRINFRTSIEIHTQNKCLVISLVEGDSIEIETQNGLQQQFNYAETFVIPAATGSVKITNKSGNEAMIVKAFVK